MKNTLIKQPANHQQTEYQEYYTRKVPMHREKKIENDLGLQMISIRLQKVLIDELKQLAFEAGIGYQPYIRQLLTRHVQEKIEKHHRGK